MVLVVKIMSPQMAQVGLAAGHPACRQLFSTILASKNAGHNTNGRLLLARTLVQSSAQSQKVTNANNQQLIPVARNISFRQCQHSNLGDKRQPATITNAKAAFSVSAANPQAGHFVDVSDQFVVLDSVEQATTTTTTTATTTTTSQQRESPIEALKRHAREAREKRQEAGAKRRYYGQSFNQALATSESSERRLVVLLSWLEAKEKHIEKYRQFYLERGFDVLNVKTSPLDLLLPNVGARKISEDFVKFMVERQYSNVVVHGFSVGGYMFGRFLLEMDKFETGLRDQLIRSIRGIVFDSLVPFEGIAPGVARSITQNPLGARLLEKVIALYLVVAKNLATKHYLEASDKVWGGPLRCPTLFLMSRNDNISDHKIVERLAGVWTNLGIECRKMLFDESPHVQMFTKHHETYVNQVDSFLKHIKAPPKRLDLGEATL